MTPVTLRPAHPDDIEFIVALETREEFVPFVGQWTADKHLEELNNPDKRYYLFENTTGERLGFAILAGLAGAHDAILLVRVVLSSPGQGLGRVALEALMAEVFDHLGANRLWLDVFDFNARAIHVYEGVGFKHEGVMREAFKRDDNYCNLVLMSILRKEWDEQR